MLECFSLVIELLCSLELKSNKEKKSDYYGNTFQKIAWNATFMKKVRKEAATLRIDVPR